MKKTWVKVKRGFITDPKHHRAIGPRIWLYLYILDNADWDTGTVYGWKDKHAAEDMGMSARTLQDQRQKLEDAGYIKCKQVLHGQDIIINNWTNPREYSGQVYNDTNNPAPLENDNGNIHGTNHGNIHPIVESRTPTYNSHITKPLRDDGFSPISYWLKKFNLKKLPVHKRYMTDDGDNLLAFILENAYKDFGKEKFIELAEWAWKLPKHDHHHSTIFAFDKALRNPKNWDKKDEGKSFEDQLRDAGYE